MRSFVEASDQYSLQYEHNQLMQERATTLTPFSRLRLLDISSGVDLSAGVDLSLQKLNVKDGFYHMQRLCEALNALDRCGWKRSFHQRQFHNDYLRACARVFFKTEAPGSFERAHKRILELNGWDSLQQEVLISTPRRFGKTISISLFCAALIFACPQCECSIYSTCKRISQKLLRNVCKFLDLIYVEMKVAPYRVIRANQEELQVTGPEGPADTRVISSYPSKVTTNAPRTHN